jgi:hypothetical protein
VATAGAPSPPSSERAGQVTSCDYRKGGSNSGRVTSPESRPLKCLSSMRGNSHAGFSKGCRGREASVPTRPATKRNDQRRGDRSWLACHVS